MSIKIVSKGTSNTTQVLIDGKPLKGVIAIEINPIKAKRELITAQVTFENVELEINNVQFTPIPADFDKLYLGDFNKEEEQQ